eukprot:scaffold1376_cov257-Pinguiococcus_pyrenoidosus.AAC.18
MSKASSTHCANVSSGLSTAGSAMKPFSYALTRLACESGLGKSWRSPFSARWSASSHHPDLLFYGTVAVEEADAASQRQRNGHLVLRDAAHRTGAEGQREANPLGELRAQIHLAHSGNTKGYLAWQHDEVVKGDAGRRGGGENLWYSRRVKFGGRDLGGWAALQHLHHTESVFELLFRHVDIHRSRMRVAHSAKSHKSPEVLAPKPSTSHSSSPLERQLHPTASSRAEPGDPPITPGDRVSQLRWSRSSTIRPNVLMDQLGGKGQ